MSKNVVYFELLQIYVFVVCEHCCGFACMTCPDLFTIVVISFLSTHADRQGVDISVTVCFSCLFVRLQISPARIKLATSNFARWFMGVLGRECFILGIFAPLEAQNRISHPPGSKVRGGKSYRSHVPIKFTRRVDVGSACVDIRQSRRQTYLYFLLMARYSSFIIVIIISNVSILQPFSI